MANTPTADATQLELDSRANDGVEVSLLWHKATNRLTVAVNDTRTGETFELDVDSRYALDAFRHPYAYAYSRGLVRREAVHA